MFRRFLAGRVATLLSLGTMVGSLFSCGSEQGTQTTSPDTQVDWDSELVVAEAIDTNHDSSVVEIDLIADETEIEILPNTITKAWLYNGQLPGPTIRVNKGDRLIVHFTNHLSEPTTIHWHGIRVPVEMDGVPDNPFPAVEPGGTFTYDFVVPDAGLYWYHPHVNSLNQVGNGLYGAIVVNEYGANGVDSSPLGDELVLVLSDMSLNDDGSIKEPQPGDAFGSLFGHEGNVLLVNGKINPTLRPHIGQSQRWRIVNTTRALYYWFDFDESKFTVIGGDGGRSSEPTVTERLLLAPAQRLDVLLTPITKENEKKVVTWTAYDHGFGTAFEREPVSLFSIIQSGAEKEDKIDPGDLRVNVEVPGFSEADNINVALTIDQVGDKVDMGINGLPFDTMIHAKVGDKQIWTVSNSTDWEHPFHLHGFFFLELDENNQPIHPLQWKDTVVVPVHSNIKLGIFFDSRPGDWMFHCHILDHAELGMMGMVHVIP